MFGKLHPRISLWDRNKLVALMTKAVVEYPANLSIISVISEAIFQHTSPWEFVCDSQVSLSSDRARF